MLATYCLPQFLHTSGLLDSGAPNPGRRNKSCSQCLGGRRLGGPPRTLGERRLHPQSGGMAEAKLRRHRCLPGVSAADMAGC